MISIQSYPLPVLGFAAFSGTGKTSLLTRLIPLLTQQGLRVGMIKHSHHDFEIDQPGKDSYKLHHAGCTQTLITSRYRSALISEREPQKEPQLAEELQKLDPSELDLVLVEGFRHESGLPRIELHRASLGQPLLHPGADNFIALASDGPVDSVLPVLDINDAEQIAGYILNWIDNHGLPD